MVTDKLKKLLRVEIVLITLILFGIYFRFYNLDLPLNGDEIIFGIGSMKFHQQDFESGKEFVREHPPLGKWLIGLPSRFIEADYGSLRLLSSDMFVWGYIAYDALGKNFIAMRVVEALLGVVSLFLIFLIARQLFGFSAAMWSTALAALSFEMVGYSRVIFMESPMITFILLTLFLYINYLKSSGKKRFAYLGLFFISLAATLLTRHIQPLFLLPIFAVSQFLLNRDMKENIYIVLLLGISYYIAFQVIFPQDILGYGQSRFGYSSIFGFFSFKMFSVIGHLLFRNSLLFLATLLFIGYIAYQIIQKKTDRKTIHPVLVVFFVLAFLIFSFLRFPLPRHYIFMFLPLYIIGGYALSHVTKNKILLWVMLLLAVINAVQIPVYFPNFLSYTNFGLDGFESFPSATFQELETRLNTLTEDGVSNLMTNDLNVLIYFDGQKSALIPSLQTTCTNETVGSVDMENLTVLYAAHSTQFSFINDQFICPILKAKLIESNVKILEV